MQEALIAFAGLIVAAIIGTFLSPTEAQIQAAAAKSAAEPAHDDGHGHHSE